MYAVYLDQDIARQDRSTFRARFDDIRNALSISLSEIHCQRSVPLPRHLHRTSRIIKGYFIQKP